MTYSPRGSVCLNFPFPSEVVDTHLAEILKCERELHPGNRISIGIDDLAGDRISMRIDRAIDDQSSLVHQVPPALGPAEVGRSGREGLNPNRGHAPHRETGIMIFVGVVIPAVANGCGCRGAIRTSRNFLGDDQPVRSLAFEDQSCRVMRDQV